MILFLVPVLVSVVVNIITALFNRKHGLKVLRYSLLILAVYFTSFVFLLTPILLLAKQFPWSVRASEIVSMAMFAVFYWFLAGAIVDALDRASETKITPFNLVDAFSFDVPYMTGDIFPIPLALDHPLHKTWMDVANLLASAAVPSEDGKITRIDALKTAQEKASYLEQCIIYSIVKSLISIQRGKSTIGYKVQKGAFSDVLPPVPPPNEVEYPTQKLIEKMEAELPMKGEVHNFTLKHTALKMPAGSDFEISASGVAINPLKFVRITNPQLFTLEFSVKSIGTSNGIPNDVWPPGLEGIPLQVETFSFTIKMNLEIKRTPANVYEVEDLRRWADGIWVGLRANYDEKTVRKEIV
jgi:hypothetical protein